MTWTNFDGTNGVKVCRYADSLTDFEGLECHPTNRYHGSAGVIVKGGGDTMGATWRGGFIYAPDYLAFVRKGWPEGIAKMRETIGRLAFPAPVSIRRRPRWADQGDEIDMGRVYGGQLDTAWRRTVRAESSGPQHVRIWTHCGFGESVRPDTFFWRGAVACMVADALEDAGYRVQLNAYSQVRGAYAGRRNRDGVDSFTAVRVKDYDQPLSLEQAAAVTAHGAFLRSAVFAARLAFGEKADDGMGSTCHDTTIPLAEPGDIVIDNVKDEDSARATATRILAGFSNAGGVK